MKLQFLSQRCLPHQALNPETGRCYNVCAEGEKYNPQSGCENLNWFSEHWKFLTVVGVASAYAWWRWL